MHGNNREKFSTLLNGGLSTRPRPTPSGMIRHHRCGTICSFSAFKYLKSELTSCAAITYMDPRSRQQCHADGCDQSPTYAGCLKRNDQGNTPSRMSYWFREAHVFLCPREFILKIMIIMIIVSKTLLVSVDCFLPLVNLIIGDVRSCMTRVQIVHTRRQASLMGLAWMRRHKKSILATSGSFSV